jgi:hypothetical protein
MKILVAGWFSFEKCNATAGDLMARDLVCEWIENAGHAYDIALAPPFVGGVDWRSVEPKTYSHVVFVCGPFPYVNSHLAPRKFDVVLAHSTNPKALILPIKAKKKAVALLRCF